MDSLITGLSIVFIYYFYQYIATGKSLIIPCVLAGLTALSKITGLVIILFIFVCLFSFYKNKEITKQISKVLIIGGILSSLYYLRNYIIFKNLFFNTGNYPYLSNLIINFNNTELNKDFTKIVSYNNPGIWDYLKEIFFDFWGVPQGHLENISFISPILINIFIILIFLISLIYILSLIPDKKFHRFLIIYIWLFAWIIAILILKENLLWGFRRLLPIAPALSILIGYSLSKLSGRKLMVFIVILLLIGVPTQTGKLIYAMNYYNSFANSMQFIKSLPDNSIILTPYVEETAYYSEKQSMSLPQLNPKYLNTTTFNKYKINYIVLSDIYPWYNLSQHNKIIPEMNFPIIYEDKNIKIYEVK